MFKLRLITGKTIIFVADIDRCYRLKLFLGQFGVRSCILNPELPVSSRIHVVEEFNRNVYDIIIASDDTEVLGDEDEEEGEGGDGQKTKASKTNGSKAKSDAPPKKKITIPGELKVLIDSKKVIPAVLRLSSGEQRTERFVVDPVSLPTLVSGSKQSK